MWTLILPMTDHESLYGEFMFGTHRTDLATILSTEIAGSRIYADTAAPKKRRRKGAAGMVEGLATIENLEVAGE